MGAVATAVTTLCQNGGSLWANLVPLLLFWVLGTVMGWLVRILHFAGGLSVSDAFFSGLPR